MCEAEQEGRSAPPEGKGIPSQRTAPRRAKKPPNGAVERGTWTGRTSPHPGINYYTGINYSPSTLLPTSQHRSAKQAKCANAMTQLKCRPMESRFAPNQGRTT